MPACASSRRSSALWKALPDGSVQEAATGVVYSPNRDTGFFENLAGERLQPGFKVFVGWHNYARMFGDADFRGPFVSIFVWTVVFAAPHRGVLAGGRHGAGRAAELGRPALPHHLPHPAVPALCGAGLHFSILVFKGLFNQNFGEINAILDALFGIKPAWFADPFLAKVMILIVNTWLGYPYIMILCAGLAEGHPGRPVRSQQRWPVPGR